MDRILDRIMFLREHPELSLTYGALLATASTCPHFKPLVRESLLSDVYAHVYGPNNEVRCGRCDRHFKYAVDDRDRIKNEALAGMQ